MKIEEECICPSAPVINVALPPSIGRENNS